MVTVNDTSIDVPRIDRQNSFAISADVSDADYVVFECNDRVLQMEKGPASPTGFYYRRRIHAVELGVFTGNGYVVGYDRAGGTCHSMAQAVVVDALDPIQPEEWYKSLLEAELSHTTLRNVNIDIEDERQRIDKQNGTGVVIAPSSRLRQNVAKHQYKNIWYPLTVIIYSNDSRKDCEALLEAVLAVEEKYVNVTGNDLYDMIKILDDGKLIPSWNTFVYKHTIQLRKYLQKVQIAGY